MKLLAGLAAAALAGLAAGASQKPTEVFLLRSQPDSDNNAEIPLQIARQILLQRLGADYGKLLGSPAEGVDPEKSVSYIQQYGKTSPGLFVETNDAGRPLGGPAQLVLMIEGATKDNVKPLEEALPKGRRQPTFAIREPRSGSADAYLPQKELVQAGVHISSSRCGIAAAFNPFDSSCWDAGVFVGVYGSEKAAETIDTLAKNMPRLLALVDSGEVEAMVLLLPGSSSQKRHLAARAADSESVIIEEDPAAASVNDGSPIHNFVVPASAAATGAAAGTVPACFQSFNSCMVQTGNCTGHGRCRDKYNPNIPDPEEAAGQAAAGGVCYACQCLSTLNRPEKEGEGPSTTQWAGAKCQKEDASVQFWLILGLSVTLLAAISFAVGLLFSVGEEQLPGVIGAGVSRTK